MNIIIRINITQMASKYLQKYPVPAGFQQILADFTREVLRDQPANVIEYGAKYFEMLEKGEKFEFNSKFNVNKDDKKYQLAYNPKNAEQITKKASNIAARVDDSGKPIKSAKQPQLPNKVDAKAQPAQAVEHKVNASSQKIQAEPKKSPSVHKNVSQHQIPPQIIHQVNRIFDSMDINRNGFIESGQVKKAIKVLQQQTGINEDVSEKDIQQFIDAVDANNDGKISRQEFIEFVSQLLAPFMENMQVANEGLSSKYEAEPQAGTEKTVNQQQVQNYMSEQDQRVIIEELKQKCDQIFNQIDVDHSNFISSSQIARAVKNLFGDSQKVTQAEIAQFVQEVDQNRDGKISREQLFQFMAGFLNIDLGDQNFGQGQNQDEQGEEGEEADEGEE